MTGVAIKAESGKRFCSRIDSRGVTTRTAIGKTVFIPSRFFGVEQFLRVLICAQNRLCVQYRKFAVAIFFQEPQVMATAHEVFNLRSDTGKRRLAFENFGKFGRIFALAYGDAVRVARPAWADVVAMAKQTFVTVNEFRHGLADMIAAPGLLVGGLCRLLETRRRSVGIKVDRREKTEKQCQHLELGSHQIYPFTLSISLRAQILKSRLHLDKGKRAFRDLRHIPH